VAEIVTASKDGMTLVYTDSETKSVGFVDIVDPSKPSPLGTIGVGGEPTSISTWGDYAMVAVNTSANYVDTSGKLMAIDIVTRSIVKEWELGGQPDSVAISKDGKYIVIAIENERDEDLGEGIPPQVRIVYSLYLVFLIWILY
jgi:DNA-binding beta-propeller fold protein YncE